VFTCPECHGSLLKLRGERPERYRCHTGHAYTPEALLSELREVSEHAVWSAVRSIQEASMLLSHLADHWRNIDPPLSSDFARRAKAERTKADTMRELLLKAGMEEISEATDAP
jgi:two-component system chemotaxis response regulator CheB